MLVKPQDIPSSVEVRKNDALQRITFWTLPNGDREQPTDSAERAKKNAPNFFDRLTLALRLIRPERDN